MSKLTIRTGPQSGMDFSLDRPVTRIGRGSTNDIVIQDTQSSRHHAEITRQGDQLIVQDLGSTNGTFVNGERITAPRLLRPGDQIRIGETSFGFQAAPLAATPAVGSGWESDLLHDTGQVPAAGRPKWLIWGLAALIVLLVAAAAGAAVLLLRGGEATPTAVAGVPTAEGTVQPIAVAPTPTPLPEGEEQAGSTALVELPTTELLPTVEVQITSPPAVKPPTALPPAAATSPQVPPVAAGQLEQLPEAVRQYLGDVPPDQLSQVLAAQIQSMPQAQVQQMIAALFPGVRPDSMLPVVAASFPGMSQADLQRLLNMAYPGQNIPVPEAGPVGGRLALGIYDKAADRWDLYLANASGGQPTLLMEQGSEPDFSPDGQWVVYFSWAPDRLGLRLIKTDGSGDTQLTTTREHSYPTFSPDGGRISFYHQSTEILHTINRDGSGQRDIGQGQFPAWSPTGDLIAYRGCMGSGRCGLIVANADGSNPRQITTHANDAAPRWSPNGGQIAFHSDRDGNWEIYVINLDGSWLRRITDAPATDVMPVWSPDGLRIAFRSDRGGQGAVWATSGIGGPAFKLLDAGFDIRWPDLAQMDWTR
jgi:hypothetical protein